MGIKLRPAKPSDRHLLYKWRNDPWLVSLSTTQKTVTESEHANWFVNALNDKDQKLLIILHKDGWFKRAIPVGHMRFTRLPNQIGVLDNTCNASITLYFPERYCGRGYGRAALEAGMTFIKDKWNIKYFFADVRADNTLSQKFFTSRGVELDIV